MIENTRLEQSTDAHVARAAVGDALPVLTVLPLPVRASPVIANVGARHLLLVITDVAGAAIAFVPDATIHLSGQAGGAPGTAAEKAALRSRRTLGRST
jgi:fructose-1,6-bisphosphatase/sedoheptulose 1,7-bisphosphatase-like protein